MGITTGANKWRRKTVFNSAKWKQKFQEAAPAYAEGVMGASDGQLPPEIRAVVMQSDPVSNYAIAGQTVPESNYLSGVMDADKNDRWKKGWLRSFGGGGD